MRRVEWKEVLLTTRRVEWKRSFLNDAGRKEDLSLTMRRVEWKELLSTSRVEEAEGRRSFHRRRVE